MPIIRIDTGDDAGSSNTQINYPISFMREIAKSILKNVDMALVEHDQECKKLETYTDTTPSDFGVRPVKMVTIPHETRLRASYEWQSKLAHALLQAADLMEAADNDSAKSFCSDH